MRWNIVKTIFLKEIRETLRDRRTMIIMLFLPVVMYPALLVIFSQIMSYSQTQIQEQNYRVLILGDAPESLIETIEEDQQLEVVNGVVAQRPESLKITTLKPDEGEEPFPFKQDTIKYDDLYKPLVLEAMNREDADIAILLPKDFLDDMTNNRTGKLLVLYDDTEEGAHVIRPRLRDALVEFRKRERKRRLEGKVEYADYRTMAFQEDGIAPAAKKGGNFAGRIIPLLLMMMVMLGAFYPAVDLTAGEKERGTMQTLLTAPALPIEIIFGKFFTVFVVAMISALANLGSMILAIVFVIESNSATQDLNLQFPPSVGIVLFLQLIPVAIIFSALMLAVASFAKSFKEAQNYLTPVYLIVIIPIIISALPGFNLTAFTALIPILNITLLMKEMMVEIPDVNLILTVLVANLVYSILTLLAAVKIFKSEMVLLGGQGAVSDAFSLKKVGKPNGAVSVGFFAIIFVLYFYGGMAATMLFRKLMGESEAIIAGLVAGQFLFLAVPVFVFIKWQKYNFKDILSLNRPRLLDTIAVFMMGLTSWFVLTLIAKSIQNPIFELIGMEDLPNPAEQLFTSGISIVILVAVISLTPAICEELVFRGVIMAGFKESTSKWKAILLTALLFGLMHQHFKTIFPTAFIGLFVTIVVWQSRSLFLGILFHAMHNGIITFLAKTNIDAGDDTSKMILPGLMEEKISDMPMIQVAGAFIIFITGAGLFYYSSMRRNKSKENNATIEEISP